MDLTVALKEATKQLRLVEARMAIERAIEANAEAKRAAASRAAAQAKACPPQPPLPASRAAAPAKACPPQPPLPPCVAALRPPAPPPPPPAGLQPKPVQRPVPGSAAPPEPSRPPVLLKARAIVDGSAGREGMAPWQLPGPFSDEPIPDFLYGVTNLSAQGEVETHMANCLFLGSVEKPKNGQGRDLPNKEVGDTLATAFGHPVRLMRLNYNGGSKHSTFIVMFETKAIVAQIMANKDYWQRKLPQPWALDYLDLDDNGGVRRWREIRVYLPPDYQNMGNKRKANWDQEDKGKKRKANWDQWDNGHWEDNGHWQPPEDANQEDGNLDQEAGTLEEQDWGPAWTGEVTPAACPMPTSRPVPKAMPVPQQPILMKASSKASSSAIPASTPRQVIAAGAPRHMMAAKANASSKANSPKIPAWKPREIAPLPPTPTAIAPPLLQDTDVWAMPSIKDMEEAIAEESFQDAHHGASGSSLLNQFGQWLPVPIEAAFVPAQHREVTLVPCGRLCYAMGTVHCKGSALAIDDWAWQASEAKFASMPVEHMANVWKRLLPGHETSHIFHVDARYFGKGIAKASPANCMHPDIALEAMMANDGLMGHCILALRAQFQEASQLQDWLVDPRPWTICILDGGCGFHSVIVAKLLEALLTIGGFLPGYDFTLVPGAVEEQFKTCGQCSASHKDNLPLMRQMFRVLRAADPTADS